ncbi:ARM repeat-containing protein [Lactarius pseudohatsudake]|nr:ARM repeat-containing protein [Lactarius pseudohatsudake]
METAERYVRTWVASPRDKEIEDTVSGISDGQLKLVHVVKALGEYLTSEEDDLRNKGVEFLALVVGKSPLEKFNLQSTKVLVAFFASKLEDTETIIPALKGILAITRIPALSPENVIDICAAIFAHVKMQALVQVQRHTVFSIFDSLVAMHRDVLKSMGERFLSDYIALVDGEKDPRNLMIAFAIARVLAIEFDISIKFEDLFNITFCYFPITFRAPENDPYGITAEDLKITLRSCLSASPLFGNLAVPLFLDKINAGSPATKRDTLQTLSVCLPVYGSRVAGKFARQLWSSLKLEIFQPTDPETEEEALKATQVVIKTIYADEITDAEVDGLAKDACEECIQILKEPEKSQAKPAIKVLCAFMSTTPSVSRYTLSHVVPHLTRLSVDPDELPNRGAVLSLLASLIAASRDSALKVINSEEIFLLPFKDEVLGVLVLGLKGKSSLCPAIEGLSGLVTTPDLLDDDEIGFVVQKVNDVISDQQEDLGASIAAALDLLKTISCNTPSHIARMTLPLLFSTLPEHAPVREDIEGREKYRRGLSALSHLCTQPDLFETLVVRLSVRLSFLYAPTTVPEDTEPSAAYAHALLSTLADVLARKVERGDLDVPKYVDRLVPRLFNLAAYGVLLAPGSPGGTGLGVSSRLINLVVQSLSAQKQETFASTLFAAYLKGEVATLAAGDLSLPADTRFSPFDLAAPEGQASLVPLFSGAVIALRPEARVRIPVDDEGAFLEEILNWSIRYAKNNMQRECAWQVVTAVVNKHALAQDLDAFLDATFSTFWNEEIATSPDPDTRRRAISAWAWISRALLVRGHPKALRFADRLFELFGDADVGWDAARAIGQVGTADKELTKRNHAIIKILHAQKYASSTLPKIIAGAQDSTDPLRQTVHLVALAALIKAIPKIAYEHEFPTLMPLLLRGLSLPDPTLRAGAAGVIDTLLSAAQADVEAGAKTASEGSVITEHASSLASIMLQNSAASEMADTRVRVGALKYLAVLPKIVRYSVLHPQKATVLRELARASDDPKRAVRKEAVEARTSWFRYSG